MKISDIFESTCAGAVASVAMPMTTQKRTKESVDVPGLQPAEKVMKGKAKKKGPYANSISESKKVSEAHLDEEDLIVVPGQGRNMRAGFVPHDPDRGEHEGETLKNSLRTIVRLASELDKRLSDKDQFPEWVSEKIGGIKAMMSSTMQYLASQQDAGKPFESIPNGGTIAGGVAFEGAPSEGAKVDRMVKHIAKSERESGKSKDKATDIAWATLNKRGYLDNANHKKGK
jgi:hypothetical protein